MGRTSSWRADIYDRSSARRIRSGSTIYTDDIRSGRAAKKASPLLNILDEDGNPKVRESRDSDVHPNSTPIVIAFDETGSMGENPSLIQEDLKKLFGLVQRKNYLSDPQIAIGAYGDAYCDSVPIQFGQFESGNEVDEELENVYVEGCGGGNDGETSALIPYYVSKYVKTDAWDKRKKKGYLFLIGDECSLDLNANTLKKFIGEKNTQGVKAEDAFKMAQEKWEVYFLLINNFSAQSQDSKKKYSRYIGKDHVIIIESGSVVAGIIAAIIGANEDTVDNEDELGKDLVDAGFNDSQAMSIRKSTKSLYKVSSDKKVAVKAEDAGDLDLS